MPDRTINHQPLTSKVLIACVGGFLGSGKTTVVVAAARELVTRGLRVGIITNDQGSNLVDTEIMRGFGFATEEITGGCFCCKFDELIYHAERILDQEKPNVIFAEAVGSCTDLSATVYQPLRKYYADRFDLAPLSILVEPSRLRAFLEGNTDFLEKVAYLFERQLAEADLIVLNKLDLVTQAEHDELRRLLVNFVGNVPVLAMSALAGRGVANWVDMLLSSRNAGEHTLDIDYQVYAQAEAALGWLNATVDVTASDDFSPKELGEKLIEEVQRRSLESHASIAHLKILVATEKGCDRIASTVNQVPPRWEGEAEFDPAR